ncbi:MAG: CRISPR system precrRNA processing endoribonuclease RAMP protein Cas6 [Bryobacteraceae bacterium]
MTFDLTRLRFRFRAAEPLYFPPGKAGNTLRGAFGIMLRETAGAPEYARIFEPKALTGPSGLANPPRPFVIRAAHLDGQTIPPATAFHFDVHLFARADDRRELFITAFARLAQEGLGPTRARTELLAVDQANIAIHLDGPSQPAVRIRIRFLTPTELPSRDRQGAVPPEFPVLFARLRDRISTLRALYGPGPLDIDFRAIGQRAAQVRLTHCDITWHDTTRRSSRTGQSHPLGGFTGQAEYQAPDGGDLAEFLPYLRAGQWTGVGRQTVWGKGEICFQPCS